MRIGLFGGSFNPAHEGHAHAAETALKRLGLHRVWWLVTPQNPLKAARDSAPLATRMKSARQQARGRAMVVSDLESRWGTQFSIDLLKRLKRRFPGVHFVWVMGSDNLSTFHRWRNWREFAQAVPIAFVARPGALAKARYAPAARRLAAARRTGQPRTLSAMAPPAWLWLSGPLNPHSSTALRNGAKRTER
jgi:nicotinate-nucleotide adenylyltransferase